LNCFGLALGPAQGAPQTAAAAQAPFGFSCGPFLVETKFHLAVIVPALIHFDFNMVLARGWNIGEFYYETAFVFVLHLLPRNSLPSGNFGHDKTCANPWPGFFRQGGSILPERDKLSSRHSGGASEPESTFIVFHEQKTPATGFAGGI
jgi:hypothetical protein